MTNHEEALDIASRGTILLYWRGLAVTGYRSLKDAQRINRIFSLSCGGPGTCIIISPTGLVLLLSQIDSVGFLLSFWEILLKSREHTFCENSTGKLPIPMGTPPNASRRTSTMPTRIWEPPPGDGWIKVNVDGSFEEQSKEAGV